MLLKMDLGQLITSLEVAERNQLECLIKKLVRHLCDITELTRILSDINLKFSSYNSDITINLAKAPKQCIFIR